MGRDSSMLWMWGCAGVRRFEATRVFGGVSLFGGGV